MVNNNSRCPTWPASSYHITCIADNAAKTPYTVRQTKFDTLTLGRDGLKVFRMWLPRSVQNCRLDHCQAVILEGMRSNECRSSWWRCN